MLKANHSSKIFKVGLFIFLILLIIPIYFLVQKNTHSFKKGEASYSPLRANNFSFRNSMKNYPLMTQAQKTDYYIPGIYGAYGLKWSNTLTENNVPFNNTGSTTSQERGFSLVKSMNYTPQGLTLSDKHMFISAYDHKHKLCSVIFVLDLKGNYIKTIGLDNSAHVGGIGYDLHHHYLWVADFMNGKAVISAISQKEIDNYDIKRESPVNYGATIYIDTIKRVSSLEFHNGLIFMGYFTKKSTDGQVQLISIKGWEQDDDGDWLPDVDAVEAKDGSLHVTQAAAFKAPNQMQGIAVGDGYIYMTQSYGSKNSKLLRYELQTKNDLLDLTNGRVAILPPYLEQISMDLKGNIYPLFESSALAYRKKTKAVVDRIVKITPKDFTKYSQPDNSIQDFQLVPIESKTTK